jgi:xanthine dehydrogenase accessory factor
MTAERDEILALAAEWADRDGEAALATVIETWGSAPRPAGSLMAVSKAGDFAGSVSGGCVEGAVIQAAREASDEGRHRIVEFGVADADAWAVGLACGGRIRILVEPVKNGRALADIRLAIAAKHPTVLATNLATGERHLRDAVEDAAVAQALATDRAILVDEGRLFLNPFNPPQRLIVVGAVHIAEPLARMAALAGYAVTIIDPRRAFARAERFPDVTLVVDWPDEALPRLGLDTRCAVVTLTHDPKIDDAALAVALRSPAFYVGALGSTRTQAARRERLHLLGFDDDTVARIHGPVGLNIGARSPAEIAVSILAQMTGKLRGGAA